MSGRWTRLALPLLLVWGLHALLWYGLHDGLGRWTLPAVADTIGWGWGCYLGFSALAIPASVLTVFRGDRFWSVPLAWVGLLAMGLFSSLCIFALLRAVAFMLMGAVGLVVLPWAGPSAWGVLALAGLVTLAGGWGARARPGVVHIDIPIDLLPPALNGFRIVQITDIHVSQTIRRRYLQRIVDMVNQLDADVVAITGDVVDGAVATLQDHVAPLQQLRARDGVALVLGNHEMYSGAMSWVAEFRRLGLRVLLNEHVVLQRDAATLALAGVTDHTSGHFLPALACDPQAAIRGAGACADVRVLLAHQPITAPAAADAGFHLSLHGHTHGGQWWPWNYFVRLQQPVVKGLHRVQSMWSYTSVGTGYWGPPKRHFRSEITVLTLRPGAP